MDEYSKLIFDLITNGHQFDYAQIAFNLAKENPRMFCDLAGILKDANKNFNIVVDPFIKAGQQIQAIKELRTLTGWGLKESKDYCDDRRTELGIQPPRY